MKSHTDNPTLNAYLDGDLAGEAARTVEAHLHECDRCAAEMESLRSVSAAMAALPAIEPTPDEHRQLRQAVLSAHTPARAQGFSRLQWGLAGSFVLILVASIGFAFFSQTGRDAGEALDSGAESTAGAGPQAFASAQQLEDYVLALPQIAAIRADGGDGGGGGMGADEENAAGATAMQRQDLAESAQAPENESAPAEAGDEAEAMLRATGPEADVAPATCLEKLMAAEPAAGVLLTSEDVIFRGESAQLYVFEATGPSGSPERVAIGMVVRPADCAELAPAALRESLLYRFDLS